MRRLTVLITLILLSVTTLPTNAQAMAGGFYDHTVPLITYTGASWATVSDSLNYGGSRFTSGQTTSTSARFDFSVFGDGFTLYILRNSIGATANLCVNSVCQSISYYSPSNSYSTVQVTNLGYGTHTVYVQKSSVDNTAINLDALYVHPPAPAPTVIPPTPIVVVTVVAPESTQYVNVANWDEANIQVELTDDPSLIRFDVDDSEGNPRPVSLRYEIDAGQIANVIFQAGSLVMLMMILILLARRQS